MEPDCHKSFEGLKVKDEDAGTVAAVFSTFNVIDSDGDVTLPGAFEDGAKVRISAYNHASWGQALPVGKGVITSDEKQAVMDGEFFLDTVAGKDTFTVVKLMEDLQEWSYGYDILERVEPDGLDEEFQGATQGLKKLKVHEVSPVILGAGVDTRTLEAKGKSMKLTDQITLVLTGVKQVTDRAVDVKAKRAEKDKDLGEESKGLLLELQSELKRLDEALQEPVSDDHREEILSEMAKAERTRSSLLIGK